MIKILLLGSTGAIGEHVLAKIPTRQLVGGVVTFLRREREAKFENETPVVVDFEKLDDYESHFAGIDAVVCCLGTTRRQAGSAEAFRHVDYDYVVNAATLAKKADVKMFSLVSSTAASSSSMFLYLRVKGEVEDKLKSMSFERLSIFRPGTLKRGEKARFVEKIATVFGGMPVETVAEAILNDVEAFFQKSPPEQNENAKDDNDEPAPTTAKAVDTFNDAAIRRLAGETK